MPLFINEPLMELSKELRKNASSLVGKANGKKRAELYKAELLALSSTMRKAVTIVKRYVEGRHPVTDEDIMLLSDRIRAYEDLRQMIVNRIRNNMNNINRFKEKTRTSVLRGNAHVSGTSPHAGSVKTYLVTLKKYLGELEGKKAAQEIQNELFRMQLSRVRVPR